jgi:hypothetical protein
MFRTGPPSIIRSLSLCTQQWYVSYRLSWQLADDGQRNCPKHVEFYSKNKFEKSVHLVAFVIRIYHDARSSEYQIPGFLTYAVVIASLIIPQVTKSKTCNLFPTHRKHALGMMKLQALSSSFCTASGHLPRSLTRRRRRMITVDLEPPIHKVYRTA